MGGQESDDGGGDRGGGSPIRLNVKMESIRG